MQAECDFRDEEPRMAKPRTNLVRLRARMVDMRHVAYPKLAAVIRSIDPETFKLYVSAACIQ
jgi:hypothetical protein